MNVFQTKDLNVLWQSYLKQAECSYYGNQWTSFKRTNASYIATTFGWLDLLLWAQAQNYNQGGRKAFCNAIKNNHTHIIEWILSNCTHKLYRYRNDLYDIATKFNRLEMLRFIYLKKRKWNMFTPLFASKHHHFEFLKRLYFKGCPILEVTCHDAARAGQLEILKWLISKGCKFDLSTLGCAVEHNHIDIVLYLQPKFILFCK